MREVLVTGRKGTERRLENHVRIFLLSEDVGRFRRLFFLLLSSGALLQPGCFFLPRSQDLCVCSGVVALLLTGNLLQAVELFSVELVQLRVDVWVVLVVRKMSG